MIPQRALFAHLGGRIPTVKQRAIDLFRRFHPNWKIEVITDETVPSLDLPSAYAVELSRHAGNAGRLLAAQTDIIRLWWLATRGGCYFDTDMLTLANVDSWIAGKTAFIATQQTTRLELINCAMGAEPGNPFFADALRFLDAAQVFFANQPEWTQRVGTPYLDRMLSARVPAVLRDAGAGADSSPLLTYEGVVRAEPHIFCPFSINERYDGTIPVLEAYRAQGALMVHLFEGSWRESGGAMVYDVMATRLFDEAERLAP